MADSRISALTSYTPPIAADSVPIVDSATGTTKRITWTNLVASLAAFAKTLTNTTFDTAGSGNSFSINGTAITDKTGTGKAVLDTAPQISQIELGNASDTTLSRSSAGVLAVEGVVVPTISSTNTFTNKRMTRRVTTTNAPGATPTTNSDNVDVMNFTGLNAAITSMTTNLSGTPINGDLLEFRFTDNGTARAITWGASFASTTVTLPTTTVISTMLRVLFEWNSTTSKWELLAVA